MGGSHAFSLLLGGLIRQHVCLEPSHVCDVTCLQQHQQRLNSLPAALPSSAPRRTPCWQLGTGGAALAFMASAACGSNGASGGLSLLGGSSCFSAFLVISLQLACMGGIFMLQHGGAAASYGGQPLLHVIAFTASAQVLSQQRRTGERRKRLPALIWRRICLPCIC